ncbi:MAG: hypothetical protein ISN64_00545 [Rickettsia sp.]|nr:hypothetical protein [Rickettsia sp.]
MFLKKKKKKNKLLLTKKIIRKISLHEVTVTNTTNALYQERLIKLFQLLFNYQIEITAMLLSFKYPFFYPRNKDLYPKHALSNIMNKLKGKFSDILKKEF